MSASPPADQSAGTSGPTTAEQPRTTTRPRTRHASLTAALEAENRKHAPRTPLSRGHIGGAFAAVVVTMTAAGVLIGRTHDGSWTEFLVAMASAVPLLLALVWYWRALGLPQRRAPSGIGFFALLVGALLLPRSVLGPLAQVHDDVIALTVACAALVLVAAGPVHSVLMTQVKDRETRSRQTSEDLKMRPEERPQ